MNFSTETHRQISISLLVNFSGLFVVAKCSLPNKLVTFANNIWLVVKSESKRLPTSSTISVVLFIICPSSIQIRNRIQLISVSCFGLH